MESSQYQPGGLYAREDGGASRMNTKVKTFKENMNEACNESIHAHWCRKETEETTEKETEKETEKTTEKETEKTTEKRNVGFRTHIAYIIIYT